jgi:chromosome segregation protein
LTAPGNPDDGVFDIVGPRVLAGIQMINISRLSTHPVPITSRGLITVAGQGPSDSNGAGKSSFVAGLSLLHADDQWRLQSGAQAAAELLFTAELAGQEVVHANADHGYIIGVFVPPTARTLAEFEADVLTVWLRINRQAPHVELRWKPQLHVAYGDTENDRAGSADGLWDTLPRSNGRTDIRANKLARTLYGQTVRCVSFLSTSVRASPTANLLAQPLNDLSPERIFDAIGALTGLTREIDDEQQARQNEYQHTLAARNAKDDYDRWDARVTVTEDMIQAREQARTVKADALDSWRARCARHLVDGVAADADLRHDIVGLEATGKELQAAIETAEDKLGQLTDDKTFDDSYRERVKAFHDVEADVKDLREQQTAHITQIEIHTKRSRTLREKAAAADGRTAAQAEQEYRDADAAADKAQRRKGITEQAVKDALKALAAAERGEDIAIAQVQALRAAGITGIPLVDVISLTDEQRLVWEPRLLPYRHAVVVAESAAAHAALAAVPGSLIVEADPDATPDTSGLPTTADPALTVNRFLTALRDRAGARGQIDETAGVHGVAGFAEAMTGRAGRIQTAREVAAAASAADEVADDDLRDAKQARGRATERVEATKAAIEADALDTQVKALRDKNGKIGEALDKLADRHARAKKAYETALGEKSTRDERIASAKAEKNRASRDLQHNRDQWRDKTDERARVDLPRRQEAWAGTVATAEQHLLTLTEAEQTRSSSEWDDLCALRTEQLQQACFPPGTPAEYLPEELAVVDQQRRDRRLASHIRLIPQVLRIIGQHLDDLEDIDHQQLEQISTDRAQLTATLNSAEEHLKEARLAATAVRTTLAKAIKAKLKQVSDEFDALDKAYGGYGGALDYPEPEPPADPQKPWQWTITPRWRRGEGKSLSSYQLRGNTAQMDDKAVKIVCAAALAGSQDRPLLLVLDELGRNLGSAHRRDAVALFENIGRDRAISVVGALQDDMERYAVGSSSLYIKLRRTSDASAYNQAPVVLGSEPETARVELLTDWMASYREDPQT